MGRSVPSLVVLVISGVVTLCAGMICADADDDKVLLMNHDGEDLADSAKWEIICGDWALGGEVVAERKVQRVSERIYGQTNPSGGLIYLKDKELSDSCLEIEAKTSCLNSTIVILFRSLNQTNGYRLKLTARGSEAMDLVDLTRGKERSLGQMSVASVKPETWYSIKVQCIGDRVMAKAWERGTDEPYGWWIDTIDKSHQRGKIGIGTYARPESKTPVYFSSFRQLPLEDISKPEYSTDITSNIRLRWPRQRGIDLPCLRVRDEADAIVVSGELSELKFSKVTASISALSIRGIELNPGSVPDLRIVDGEGSEYRQAYAREGILNIVAGKSNQIDDERYLTLEGECCPRTEMGKPFPWSFKFRYEIHKYTGLIQVHVQPSKVDGSPRIRKLVLVNKFGDREEHNVNFYKAYYDDRSFLDELPQAWQVALEADSRKEGVLYSEQLQLAKWGSDRIAFEFQSLGFVDPFDNPKYIDKEFLKDMHSDKFVSVGTRENQRSIDMVCVNLLKGNEAALPGDIEFKYALSFLPFRKYRPNVIVFATSEVSETPGLASISYLRRLLKRLALSGVTVVNIGNYANTGLLGIKGPPETLDRMRYFRETANHYGIHTTFWTGLPLYLPVKILMGDWSWSMDDIMRARWINNRRFPATKGVHPSYWPNKPECEVSSSCLADTQFRKWYERFQEDLLVGGYSDSVTFDCCSPIRACDNVLHHAGGGWQFCEVASYLELFDNLADFRRENKLDSFLMIHPADTMTNCQSRADWRISGEKFVPRFLPAKPELALHYNSLLYGDQCMYYTFSGGMVFDHPKAYEMMLATCSTMCAALFVIPGYSDYFSDLKELSFDYFSDRKELTLDRRSHAMWVEYLTPLVIFGVNESSVHHPFDPDYKQYVTETRVEKAPQQWTDNLLNELRCFYKSEDITEGYFFEGVTPVVYEKEGNSLLVVVKNGVEEGSCDLTINATELDLDTRYVLIYDILNSKLQRKMPEFGPGTTVQPPRYRVIELDGIDVSKGPRFFKLMNEPESPEIIWHNQVVWQVLSSSLQGDNNFMATLSGVPDSEGRVYLYCKGQKPQRIEGGRLVSYDSSSGLATVEVQTKADARCRLQVAF